MKKALVGFGALVASAGSALAVPTPFETAVESVETEIIGAIEFVVPIMATIVAAALSMWLLVRAVRWVKRAAS